MIQSYYYIMMQYNKYNISKHTIIHSKLVQYKAINNNTVQQSTTYYNTIQSMQNT